jgi:signal transduction histidine kinase
VTLALLILLSIVYATLRDQHSKEPIVAFAAGTSAFTVATVLFGDYSATHTLGFLLVGVLGQTLVLWIVFRLIETLGTASATEAKHARIHEALAHCSQALLNRGTPAPLTTALKALLDATDADYAYVDVTRIDRDGHYTWEIVADAMGADYPGDESAFVSGDYSEQEDILASLLEGQPARVITSELAGPLKDRYEDEGIRAELIAPIMIGERFTGTIGYTDHIREGSWTDIEVKALMRAAEMVAAYWEREAAREGLMELAQAKDRFIAAVSHELRTPLAAVVGFSGALAQGTAEYSPAELSEMTTTIYNQSLELTHLVDDLLTSERAASGNLTVRAVDIDLMAECRDLARSTVSDSKVDVLGDDSVIAHADSLRTRQIIRNLLTNAVRYGGGSIEIHVEPGPSIARVTVKDNGRGVSNIDADRIFDPYYRTQEGLTTPDSVGLGLAVARQLARLMEGDVVYRRTNGWTEFEFTLPLATHESTVAPILADTLSGNGHMSDGSDPRETVTVAVSPEESTDN